MKLKNILKVKTGVNSSRISNEMRKEAYTAADLEDDLLKMMSVEESKGGKDESGTNRSTYSGQLIQSLISERTALVTEDNVGKGINQNFVYFEFNKKELDPKFMCYMFNESKKIKKQRYKLSQFSIVRKSSPHMILEFNIDIPSIDVQQAVGNLYGLMLEKRMISLSKIKIDEQIVLERINQAIKTR